MTRCGWYRAAERVWVPAGLASTNARSARRTQAIQQNRTGRRRVSEQDAETRARAAQLFNLPPDATTESMIRIARDMCSDDPHTAQRAHAEYHAMVTPPRVTGADRIASMRRVFAAEAARARAEGERPSAALYMSAQTTILLCDLLEAAQAQGEMLALLCDELRDMRLREPPRR